MNIIKQILILSILLASSVGSLQAFTHPSDNVSKGISLLQQGRLEDAEAELQKARFMAPDDAVINYNLGYILYKKRKYLQSSDFFAKAANSAVKPEVKWDSLYNLGNSMYRSSNYAQAIGAYKKSLELKQDPRAEYNLKQAEKKLKEQQERQKKQQDKQSQKNNKGDKNQKDDNKKQQDKDGESKSQSDKDQNNKQDKSGKSKDDKSNKDNKSGKDKKDEKGEKGDSKENKDGKEKKQDKASPEDGKKGDQKDKRDRQSVKAPKDSKEKQKPKPKASQRARAIKNKKSNKYMTEKLLKQMIEREKEAQRHYRNGPQRKDDEDMDPRLMSPQQLREFMRRKRNIKKQNENSQDW